MPRPSERVDPVIHNRLAVLRAERGLSRQELADALGVNYQTIGYLERGEYNPSLDLAMRAAEFFGVPVEAIFSRRPFTPMSEQLYGGRAQRLVSTCAGWSLSTFCSWAPGSSSPSTRQALFFPAHSCSSHCREGC